MDKTLYPHLKPDQLALLEAAIVELAVDVPIGQVEPTPSGLRIHLYGGRVLDWPVPPTAATVRSRRK